ncbi:MAG: transcription-repair coupling factor [Bacteroidetes bacterium]|nr:transcription-repair coupling factor [Bacteroidota bacterium]
MNTRIRLANVFASFDAVVVSEIFANSQREILLTTETTADAERLYDDLVKLIGEESAVLFARIEHQSKVTAALGKNVVDTENVGQLLEGLERISSAESPLVIVAQADCLSIPVPAPAEFKRETLTLRSGEEVGFDLLRKWLREHRFELKNFVDGCGDFAVRGGIVDIFPFTETVPYRIEFFGDTIESIREFDVISQRSIAHRQELVLIPNALEGEEVVRTASVFEYLEENAIGITIEPERVAGVLEEAGLAEVALRLSERTNIAISNFDVPGYSTLDLGIRRQPNFQANLKLIRTEIDKLLAEGTNVVLMAETADLVGRLEDLLNEQIHPEHENEFASEEQRGSVQFVTPSLSYGFSLPADQKTVVYSEHELFGRRREKGTASKKRSSRSKGISLRELRSLKRGDLLVHEDKGIGKFMGLDTIEIQGSKQEVVRLSYRDNDTLFVNLDYISKLSRYSAAEVATESVTLSKLGSAEWQRTREKTKKRLKDIARNLISLYAKRKKQTGFAYSKDDVLQHEMEAAFLYEDTPDQARATEDLKKDMESGSPMDRLVCGDVGYGKTEVAMRAAMKATLDKKQVAVLVPTTILAEQHERSFRDRLERFGVSVASLSRFKTAKEQKEILAKLVAGTVDVVIGTHRILSKDVIFKDLGLLIIDEEHRFGVAAKEKLRELRATVDTLTLTATPIPRTLNFSLLGARDLSIIETPPKNRLPIQTEIITELESDTVRKAIQREMERGGQIYAINDKVQDMELFATKLRTLVPRMRVGIVHGQMPSTSIEKVMRDFLERKIDALCATKIVESGLDVPNANTIIINRAHNFGLAELYQLRGRVGRSNEQAYCYLVTLPIKNLSKDSLRRLEAMEEFSELGAGFQLAMRDLEIRGAGNLLGAEQSGFINEIGFELYQKTLAEAVEELKEEEFSDLFKDLPSDRRTNPYIKRFDDDVETVKLTLGVDALIPEHYVEDDAERFAFYQRFARITKQPELDELTKEFKDRFGPLPEEVRNLAHIASIRTLAIALGFRSLGVDDASRTLRISLPPEEQTKYYHEFFPRILDAFKTIGEARVRLVPDGKKLRILVKLQSAPRSIERLVEIETVLTTILESAAAGAVAV